MTLLMPPTAMLLGAVYLAEHIAPRDLLGLAFIAAGLAAIDGRIPRLLAEHRRPRPASFN